MNELLNIIHQELTKDKIFRTVFIGDSTVSCEWVHPNWPEIIEYVLKSELESAFDSWKVASWQLRFINSALDGSTTKDWLTRLDDYVFKYDPQLVISLMGGNDETFKFSVEEHQQNFQRLINGLSERVDQTVFCTTTSYGTEAANNSYQPYLDTEYKLRLPHNVQLVDVFTEFKKLDVSKFFTFVSEGNADAGLEAGDVDYMHPNPLGNAYIAQIVLDQAFGIPFDPEKYMSDVNSGKMFPDY